MPSRFYTGTAHTQKRGTPKMPDGPAGPNHQPRINTGQRLPMRFTAAATLMIFALIGLAAQASEKRTAVTKRTVISKAGKTVKTKAANAVKSKAAALPKQIDRSASFRRFLWVTRWDFQTPEDIKKICQNAASVRSTDLFFQVRGEGTVFFKSSIEPWASELTGGATNAIGRDPGWDPLDTAIREGHKL